MFWYIHSFIRVYPNAEASSSLSLVPHREVAWNNPCRHHSLKVLRKLRLINREVIRKKYWRYSVSTILKKDNNFYLIKIVVNWEKNREKSQMDNVIHATNKVDISSINRTLKNNEKECPAFNASFHSLIGRGKVAYGKSKMN